MAHWKSVTSFPSTHAVQQQMQGVKSQLRRFTFSVLRVNYDGSHELLCFRLAAKL